MPDQTTLPLSFEDALDAELRLWRERGLERFLRPLWQRSGGAATSEAGRFADFSSNDYLGLASDARLVQAMQRVLERDAVGAGASRLIAGDHPEHDALEAEIAQFFRAPAARLFNNGFAANVGTIPALVGADDMIFADAFNHASLIDGCRLSRAKTFTYEHGDMDRLRSLLAAQRHSARRALIISDGLFSMDGDLADVPAIVELAREFDAWTYIDDAHAVGVVGANGRGTAEHYGLEGEVDISMGTLGKAFGVAGAFIHGSERLCTHLLNRARSFVYSTAMLPAQAAAARESIRIVANEPDLRQRLDRNVRRIRRELAALNVTLLGYEGSHIVPVVIGDGSATMQLAADLASRGVLVGAVRPPTVAHGASRLRISVSASHGDEQITTLVRAFGTS